VELEANREELSLLGAREELTLSRDRSPPVVAVEPRQAPLDRAQPSHRQQRSGVWLEREEQA